MVDASIGCGGRSPLRSGGWKGIEGRRNPWEEGIADDLMALIIAISSVGSMSDETSNSTRAAKCRASSMALEDNSILRCEAVKKIPGSICVIFDGGGVIGRSGSREGVLDRDGVGDKDEEIVAGIGSANGSRCSGSFARG